MDKHKIFSAAEISEMNEYEKKLREARKNIFSNDETIRENAERTIIECKNILKKYWIKEREYYENERMQNYFM